MNLPCYYCGVPMTRSGLRRLTWDHKVAKTHGGTNHESNLVATCNICNQEKGSISEIQFLRQLASRGVLHAIEKLKTVTLLKSTEGLRREEAKSKVELSPEWYDLKFLYEIGSGWPDEQKIAV